MEGVDLALWLLRIQKQILSDEPSLSWYEDFLATSAPFRVVNLCTFRLFHARRTNIVRMCVYLLHAIRMRHERTAAVDAGVAVAVPTHTRAVSSVVLGRQHPRVERDRFEIIVVLDRRREISEVIHEVAEKHLCFCIINQCVMFARLGSRGGGG